MRHVAICILLSLLAQLPFVGAVNSICFGRDHVAVNCHDVAADSGCHESAATDDRRLADEEDCYDLAIGAHATAPVRPAQELDVLTAISIPAIAPLSPPANSADARPYPSGDDPPPAFSALAHARTIVIRC